MARAIYARQPDRHIDVGSSIYGFVSHVASFREIEVLDVRPVQAEVPGIIFRQQDLMCIGSELEGITDSVSCLHALEHFGLGRYGDPLDYDGWKKGLAGLHSMLTQGGILYLSVPTGEPQRIEFNAHRVFSFAFLRDYLLRSFDIEDVHFITDEGNLLRGVDWDGPQAQFSFGARYGCSVWTLRRR